MLKDVARSASSGQTEYSITNVIVIIIDIININIIISSSSNIITVFIYLYFHIFYFIFNFYSSIFSYARFYRILRIYTFKQNSKCIPPQELADPHNVYRYKYVWLNLTHG